MEFSAPEQKRTTQPSCHCSLLTSVRHLDNAHLEGSAASASEVIVAHCEVAVRSSAAWSSTIAPDGPVSLGRFGYKRLTRTARGEALGTLSLLERDVLQCVPCAQNFADGPSLRNASTRRERRVAIKDFAGRAKAVDIQVRSHRCKE